MKHGKHTKQTADELTGHNTRMCATCRHTALHLDDKQRKGKQESQCQEYKWTQQLASLRPTMDRWNTIVQQGQVGLYKRDLNMTEAEILMRSRLMGNQQKRPDKRKEETKREIEAAVRKKGTPGEKASIKS